MAEFIEMIDLASERVGGKALYATDDFFASKDNLKAAKAADVKDVCFSKRRGMAITDLAKSELVYRRSSVFALASRAASRF